MMNERRTRVNELAEKVASDPTFSPRSRAAWSPIDAGSDIPFPLLTLDYLHFLTCGTYQVSLAPSYIAAHLSDSNEFHLEIARQSNRYFRGRLQSRHSGSSKYMLWIEVDFDNNADPIRSWYCCCKTGARTLGMCGHLCAVISYLGFFRHQDKEYGPLTKKFKRAIDNFDVATPSTSSQ